MNNTEAMVGRQTISTRLSEVPLYMQFFILGKRYYRVGGDSKSRGVRVRKCRDSEVTFLDNDMYVELHKWGSTADKMGVPR